MHFLLLFALCISVRAKDSPVTAIALFDGPSGASYVQISGLMLNGKTEVRICDGISKFDKRAYDLMMRTQLAAGASLERGTDGVLKLTINSKSLCVVPNSLKFVGGADLTPAEAAEQAVIQGTIISSPATEAALPAFKPGVQLVFVTAPDNELAGYLRAQRANSIKDWQDFLLHYPSSARAANARNALAEIIERSAESAFTEYQKLAASHKPDISLLKQAREQAQEANRAASGYRPAIELIEAISRELDTLLESDRARLAAFRKALETQSSGLLPMNAARRHTTQLLEVRPDYAPVLNLHREIVNEELKLASAMESAESLVASKHYDEAVEALGAYRCFASEFPRIDSVLTAAYTSHFNHGQELVAKQEWEQAAAEFQKALAVRANSEEASAALKNAKAQLVAMHDRQAVEQALQQSKEYTGRKEFIDAYEVLADLPDSQRPLVSDQLAALSKDYVTAASRRAQKLQEIHIPIKGRADEDAVREAHELLNHATSLTGDPAIKLKLDLLDDKISAYYVDQARRYLQKPLGSGVGVGWLYLNEAQRYRTTNEQAIKDEVARYSPTYQLRARLSVGIVLRDQTSRRDSVGFTDQLTDAIASGLESSPLSVKVIRQPRESTDTPQPNFLLVGEIREHRVVKNSNLETVPSKYRAGTHDTKNPEWLQANRDFEAAKQQLTDAQHSLTDAQMQHKKKEIIAAANDAVQTAQKHVDETRHKLDTTDQNRAEAVIESYNYTKKNIELTALIDLGIRIADQSGNMVDPAVNIKKENHKSAVVLENVKPEDTEGVTKQDTDPDEVQFLADLEIAARDELVKTVREKAAALPGKILQEARNRAQRGDTDGAAEQYVLYLNATADKSSAERDEASKFLHDQFNVTVEKKLLAASY